MRQLDAASPRDPVSENRARPFGKRAPSPLVAAPRRGAASISASRPMRCSNASFAWSPSREDVARAPARVLSALPQNALNSNGCRCFRPYTKRPAGRCCSRVVTAA